MTDTHSGASPDAIQFHYEEPPAFFAQWLGESMTYTAARYSRPGMTLDEAQRDKIAYHLDAGRVAEGHRVLDIGCGWGTLMKAAVADRGAASGFGLTLSALQRDYVNTVHPDISARLESYEHFSPDAPFDAILSVGAFEHFSRPGVTKAERMATYDAFFERCAAWLTPDGHLSLQTMTWGDANQSERDLIKIHDVFPESDLPEISEVIEAAHPYLECVSMENRPEDYAQTLQAWADGLKTNADAAEAIVGPERYGFFLQSCKGGALLYRRRRYYLCRFAFRRRGR